MKIEVDVEQFARGIKAGKSISDIYHHPYISFFDKHLALFFFNC